MRKTTIKYALIVFVITVIWTLVEHALGYNTTNHEVGQYTRLITAFVYYAFVAIAIWARKKQQNNKLTFGEGFKTGTALSVLYGVLVTVWFAVYAEVINPQYQPSLLAYERSKLEALNTPPAEIAIKLKEVEMNSGGSITSYLLLFFFMTLFGLFVAAIASLIMKRTKRG